MGGFFPKKSDSLKKNEFIYKDFLKNNNINNLRQPTWVEIWNIDSKITKLEKLDNSPWNLHFKYKLSMVKSWHILEERFMIFFLVLLFIFF